MDLCKTVANKNTAELVKRCFPVPSKARDIISLVKEYECLRWDAFYCSTAMKRIIEIDEKFKELGLAEEPKSVSVTIVIQGL